VEVNITAGNAVGFRGDCNHLIVLGVVSPDLGALARQASPDQTDSTDEPFRSCGDW
jgi:hypothetical protein